MYIYLKFVVQYVSADKVQIPNYSHLWECRANISSLGSKIKCILILTNNIKK